jgi:hypothetical protein
VIATVTVSYRTEDPLTPCTNATPERLLFLDQTLEGMIRRFEDEFPETRLPSVVTSPPIPDASRVSPEESIEFSAAQGCDTELALIKTPLSDDEYGVRPVLSRHNSDVSLASRALSEEEGRMHRVGQKFRRDILQPEGEDHDAIGKEDTPMNLQLLRAMVDGLHGEEIRNEIEMNGQDALLEELSNDASDLRRQLIDADPESWEKFRESQEAAQRSVGMDIRTSAVE